MPGTGHNQGSGRQWTFLNCTHCALPAFLPNNTKWIKKASEKERKSAGQNQPQTTIPCSAKKKRKGKWVKQCERFIPLLLNSFSKGGVWAHHNYSFLSCISPLLWSGFCKLAFWSTMGPNWDNLSSSAFGRGREFSPKSLSEKKVRTSLHYAITFTAKIVSTPSSWNNKLQALTAKMPASALSIKFSCIFQYENTKGDCKI